MKTEFEYYTWSGTKLRYAVDDETRQIIIHEGCTTKEAFYELYHESLLATLINQMFVQGSGCVAPWAKIVCDGIALNDPTIYGTARDAFHDLDGYTILLAL